MDDEGRELEEEIVDDANTNTAQTINNGFSSYRGARKYTSHNGTRLGKNNERKTGNMLGRIPSTNKIMRKSSTSGPLNSIGNQVGSTSTKNKSSINKSSSTLNFDKKAKVKIKMPLPTPILVALIVALSGLIFLLLFISVILTSIGYFDDDTSVSDSLAYLSTLNTECQTLTVEGKTVSLEEYVAVVVASEIGNSAPYEAKKALAIAARTYVIKGTNNCQNEVPATDEKFQVYNTDNVPNEDTINAVADTAGQVLFLGDSLLLAQYDAFCKIEKVQDDGTGGFNCDDEYCYVTYAKNNNTSDVSTWEHHIVKVPKSYTLNGGHCHGMSQVAAMYMASNGSTAEEILETFYDSDMTIESMSSASGLEITDIPNYYARTSRATRNNSYYYDQSTDLAIGLEGECAWYGYSRAKEILATSGSSKTFSRGGNGGEFCEIAQSFDDPFTISTDVNTPKAGSLIVWKGGTSGYGHVAVIEKVIDSDTVLLSEAGIGIGKFGSEAREMLWTSGSKYEETISYYGSNALARKANCEGNNTGCQSFKEVSISSLSSYIGLNFACYVYLLDD